MSSDHQFLAERLVWRFKKSGGEGVASKSFQQFSEDVQEAVRASAGLHGDETPAVLCYFSEERWTLLTTTRLVWRTTQDADITSLDLNRIINVTVEGSALLRAGGKKELSILTVVERGGDKYQIELEPGMPFSGFWNAVKAAAGV